MRAHLYERTAEGSRSLIALRSLGQEATVRETAALDQFPHSAESPSPHAKTCHEQGTFSEQHTQRSQPSPHAKTRHGPGAFSEGRKVLLKQPVRCITRRSRTDSVSVPQLLH